MAEQPPEYPTADDQEEEEEDDAENAEEGTDDVDAFMDDGEEDGEEEEDEEEFSLLGESSEDEEQKSMYQEYLQLIKEINEQNTLIEQLKDQLAELRNERCPTRANLKEQKEVRVCMAQEKLKLDVLAMRAVQLQNCGSHRHYRELNIAMTDDEDSAWEETQCSNPCDRT